MDFSTEIWKDWAFGYQFSTCGRLRRIETAGRQVAGFVLKPKTDRRKAAYYFTFRGKNMGRAAVELWRAVWPELPPPHFDKTWGEQVKEQNALENKRLYGPGKRESVESSARISSLPWALTFCPYASGQIHMPGFDYTKHPDLGLGCWGYMDED